MLLFPNSKINVGLDILRRRTDGYHDVRTLMVPVRELCDVLEIVPAATTEFVQTGAPLDCPPEANLCMHAYRLMEREYGIGGVKIHLHKIVPSGAGLGGGSADAAFVLRGLDKMFGLGLSVDTLEKLAAELGSDTPFFIRNEPAMATGRGEILTPAENPFAGKWAVLVVPPIHISTKEAYAGVVAHEPEVPLSENAFEAALFPKYPALGRIKRELLDHGAIYASLSGSGSTVYGIFEQMPVPFCISEKNCVILQFRLS